MSNPLLTPKLPKLFSRPWFLRVFLMIGLIFIILPWVTFTTGRGQVTAINPNERIQTLTSPIGGFVKQWLISEGDRVKQGQIIAELTDVDQSLLERMGLEQEAAKSGLSSSKLMMDTARLDLERQKKLFEQGLSARKDYEKAKIEYSKLEVEYAKNQATLAKAQTQFSRQGGQRIVAPRDGTVTRILPGENGVLLKPGSPIAIFAPDISTPAVEIWVDGLDVAFLQAGQLARVQFEGWPALQIPGWPSVAIGTFPAKVHLVDQASSLGGKFRVLLVPSGPWPSQKLLRLGAQAKGFVQLRQSLVANEIWRQLNGFPVLQEPLADELNMILKTDGLNSSSPLKDKK